eukprot:1640565-Pyramimonas_sp.AAC.1
MRVMAEVFELAISHDQLNVASLAAFERLGRRWQAMLEAHGKNLMNPNYEIADKFSGYNRRQQLVAPALRTYVAKEVRPPSLPARSMIVRAAVAARHAR